MNQSEQMQLDLSKADDVICECGSKVFVPVMMMKRISPLVSPTGQEAMVPIQLYACIKCHEIPEAFKKGMGDLD
tara:strand:+ start:486 stop:707 length:222 start_codon:yes stop_codon:yes gene_type:complete